MPTGFHFPSITVIAFEPTTFFANWVGILTCPLRGVVTLAMGSAATPACFFHRALANTILEWHEQKRFDVVFTYCTAMIRYARQFMRMNTRPRHIIDLGNVDSVKWLDYAQHTRGLMRWVYRREAKHLARIKTGQIDNFDAVTVVSDAEAELYRQHVGHHTGLTVLRHAVDVQYFYPMPDVDSKTLLLVGALNYRPNIEGINWFVDHVMPTLRRRFDDVRLLIVGRDMAAPISALCNQPGVEVIGPVEDVRTYIQIFRRPWP